MVLSEKSITAGRSKGSDDCPQASANQGSAPFLRAAVIPASAQSLSESAGQGRSFGARVILANGVTIDVPVDIAPDALGAFIHAALQITTCKGVSSR